MELLRQRIAEQRVAMGGINNSAEQAVKVGTPGGNGQESHSKWATAAMLGCALAALPSAMLPCSVAR